MFNSIFDLEAFTNNYFGAFFIMAGVSLALGVLFSFVASFKVRSSKRFFVVTSILPCVIAIIASITSMTAYLGAVLAISGAFGLIRFRSAQGTGEEIGVLAIEMAAGFVLGLGYLAAGALILLGLALVYFLLSSFNFFEHKKMPAERVLRVTIPENLDYAHCFDDELNTFTKSSRLVRSKTINMGSMYRLEYEVVLKNGEIEKPFLDAIRVKNGNLEVSLTESTRVVDGL